MVTVKQLLDRKGHEVWSTKPDALVYDALAVMAEKNVGALLVMDREKLLGIFSERDFVRKVFIRGKSSRTTPVSVMMTSDVITVGLDQSIEECMTLMTDYKIRHLPVVDNDKVVGIISIGDLVNAIIGDQKFVITQLENYIRGSDS